ncbi:putative huntingtin interacting protein (HIP) [Trypanosoma grayi]|uniref:putative huntingtin interacting protein (HIP) n=1 Tax=Trypanosoma grayi TaxID=71804 RepID=UPI0004F48B74|nr:putative huntingtin interacting protein (HIP) [Trypanosoma grayi]KEG08183.1 putative huntingtin interacting protein (HIP) [Trypanosoma grayi]
MTTRGGRPLPLSYYMQSPGSTATAEEAPPVDPFTTVLGGRTFHEALRSDNGFPVVTSFLLGGVDANVRDRNGAAPLHLAAARVTSTAPGGGDDNNDDDDELGAADCPNRMIIAFLIDNGADINLRNSAGETPLMVAAATLNVGALRLLLEKGADTTRRDDMGHTVLYHAAPYPHVLQMMQTWMEDLPERVAREYLLHRVCRQGRGAEFTALFFIEQLGVDVNAREGEAAAVAASNDNDDKGMVNHHEWESTAVVTVQDGFTPLHCAVLAGDTLLVCTLLLKGADAEKPDASGVTPIQLAAKYAMPSSAPCFLLRFCRALLPLRSGSAAAKGENPRRVYAILNTYRNETSSSRREAMLQREVARGTSLWDLNTTRDVVLFAVAATLPHSLVALCAAATTHLWVAIAVALLCLSWCAKFNRCDARRCNARPLRSVGLFAGYAVVLFMCCVTRLGAAGPMLLFCAAASVVCALLVAFRGPATVESTATQRLGIYKTLFHAKGALPEDVRHSIDLHCMVKKPLRAQRCRHLGRVVLRFDHYCTWLASSIDGSTHRAYVAFLFFYTALLGGHWYGVYTSAPQGDIADASDRDLALQRYIEVYVWLVLPVAFSFFLLTLLQQLWYIGREVTSYDVAHPSRCPWCFTLGPRTYSLFDAGFTENMRRFFLMREDFLARNYRMPSMSARLQKMVKDHQAMQFSPCQNGRCHSHAHGNVGDSHNGHLELAQDQSHCKPQQLPSQQQQRQQAMPGFNLFANTDNNSGRGASSLAGGEEAAEAFVAAPAASPNPEAAVGRLFQLMVQHNSADVTAAGDVQASIPPGEWQEVVAKAQNMFGFFKKSLNGGR